MNRLNTLIILLSLIYTNHVTGQSINVLNKPRLYYPQSFFDIESATQQLSNGEATITGQAFTRDRGGAKHYASNTVVILLPYSEYLSEWHRLSKKFKNTYSGVYMNPAV